MYYVHNIRDIDRIVVRRQRMILVCRAACNAVTRAKRRASGPHWDAITSILTQYVALMFSIWYLIRIDASRNQYISWASDFYGHNDMDIVC